MKNSVNKVAAIQMVSGPDVEQNLVAARRLIGEAAGRGAQLILLPENFAVLEGGPMREYGEVEGDTSGLIQGFLFDAAKANGVTLVAGTIPLISRPITAQGQAVELIDDGRVRAACLVIGADGAIMARYDKVHLFDVKVADKQAQYSESRSYEPGEALCSLPTVAGKLGLSICYDLRFPELYRRLFHAGAQIVTVPSAFTWTTGKAHWEPLLRARAIENQCYIIAANQGGRHSENRETWGHSMIISPWGELLATLESGEGVVLAEIDLNSLQEIRARMPISEHCRL